MNGPLTRLQAANRARAEARASKDAPAGGRIHPYSSYAKHIAASAIANKTITGARSGLAPPPEPIALEAPVIGFRNWQLSALGLNSLFVQDRWEGPVMRAKCNCNRLWGEEGVVLHQAPHHDCHCGLYAMYETMGTLVGQGVHVSGAVLAWGDNFFAHKEGFRAEYMRVLAIGYHPGAGCPNPLPKPLTGLLGGVADEFEAVLVPDQKTLELVAREHGDPVPEHARMA